MSFLGNISENLLYIIGSLLVLGVVVVGLMVAFKGNDSGISTHLYNQTQREANYNSASTPRY